MFCQGQEIKKGLGYSIAIFVADTNNNGLYKKLKHLNKRGFG